MQPRRPFATNRRTPRGKSSGVRGLLQYVKTAHPDAYANLVATRPDLVRSGAQLDGLGDTGAPSLIDKAASTANSIANAVLPFLQLNAQRKLLEAQVSRAKQGLPPLEVKNLQLPAARVEVDAGEGIRAGFARYGKWLAIGALGLGALLLMRRRRRA